jgi:hypothetical protein
MKKEIFNFKLSGNTQLLLMMGSVDQTETIDLDSPDSECSNLPNPPYTGFSHTNHQGDPIVCSYDTCHSLSNGHWKQMDSLSNFRTRAGFTFYQPMLRSTHITFQRQ